MKVAEVVEFDPYKVTDILEEAKDRGFESVIVFGFKNKLVTTMTSGTASNLEIIGALEAAKQHLWAGQ